MQEITQCMKCKNHINKDKCKAFPKGIPKDIFFDEIEHDHKLPNQIGDYVYELKE